jgi:hypothetical protein
MPPYLVTVNWDFLFNHGTLPPRPFPRMLASLGPGPLHFLFLDLCFCPVPSPPGLWKSIFCPHRDLTMMGWTSTGSCRPLPPLGCFSSVLCPWWHWPLGFAFTVLDTPWAFTASGGSGLPPKGFATHGACHFQVFPPVHTPCQDYLTPGALSPRPFPRMLALFGPGPQW